VLIIIAQKYERKEKKQTEKGKVGGCEGMKDCDSFASVLHWWLRRRQWVRIESQGSETQG